MQHQGAAAGSSADWERIADDELRLSDYFHILRHRWRWIAGVFAAVVVVAFGILGFAYSDWLGLMALMLLAGFAGTYAGSLVLNRLPAKAFAIGLKTILTLLAVNLLASALGLYSVA